MTRFYFYFLNYIYGLLTQIKMTWWSTHCIFASRQNTLNRVVPIFYFIMIFNDFCTMNWTCPWFSFQKSGHQIRYNCILFLSFILCFFRSKKVKVGHAEWPERGRRERWPGNEVREWKYWGRQILMSRLKDILIIRCPQMCMTFSSGPCDFLTQKVLRLFFTWN